MCEECRHSPHLPGCPNAPEPKPECYCYLCNDPIYIGDEYYESAMGTTICGECFMSLTAYELMELNGEKLSTMQEN